MPLNTSSFLVSQGWEGVGVPLDGKAGKGLKKPLAIPQKRTLSGIGKDRDRANEWWNSIFTAGAKNLNIGPSKDSKTNSASTSGTSTPSVPTKTIDDAAATESVDPDAKALKTGWSMGPRSVMMSLSSLAKREHARKTLMSNFVRGEVIASKEPSPEPVVQTSIAPPSECVEASDLEVEAALSTSSSGKTHKKAKGSKEEKLEKKLAKQKRKRESQGQMENTTTALEGEQKAKKNKKVKSELKAPRGASRNGSASKRHKKKISPSSTQNKDAGTEANNLFKPLDSAVADKQPVDSAKSTKKKDPKSDVVGDISTKVKDKKRKKVNEVPNAGEATISKKRKRDKAEKKSNKKKKDKPTTSSS